MGNYKKWQCFALPSGMVAKKTLLNDGQNCARSVERYFKNICFVCSVFISETKKKYKIPFASSSLASWSHGESFDLAPFPPNPYQTTIAPFMYCSDYCHIAQGTSPYTVINQINNPMPAHKACEPRYIVSRDFEP